MEYKAERYEESARWVYTLTVTDREITGAAPLQKLDAYALEAFGRENATIEERLMGLQILARAVERTT